MAKEPEAAVLAIDGREVRITNPDKPYFSQDVKLTKLELVRYYLSVAPERSAESGTVLSS
jgi:DNA primase